MNEVLRRDFPLSRPEVGMLLGNDFQTLVSRGGGLAETGVFAQNRLPA